MTTTEANKCELIKPQSIQIFPLEWFQNAQSPNRNTFIIKARNLKTELIFNPRTWIINTNTKNPQEIMKLVYSIVDLTKYKMWNNDTNSNRSNILYQWQNEISLNKTIHETEACLRYSMHKYQAGWNCLFCNRLYWNQPDFVRHISKIHPQQIKA
eukprot:138972_1